MTFKQWVSNLYQRLKGTFYTKTAVNTSLAGKADLVDGKVPAAQLPSYVDDVLEFADFAHFPATGESGKIYVALDTSLPYRWSGSVNIRINDVDLSNYYNKTQVDTALGGKVDKVTGYALSKNDFTDALKTKLDGIAAGAEVNVNADWNAASGDAQILNKPSIPSKTSDLTNDSNFMVEITETEDTNYWNAQFGS